jgi:hypothetical protein
VISNWSGIYFMLLTVTFSSRQVATFSKHPQSGMSEENGKHIDYLLLVSLKPFCSMSPTGGNHGFCWPS